MRQEYLPRMEFLDPQYDETVDEKKERIYLYLGDEFGILKQWDLTYVIHNSGLQTCRPLWEVRGDQYFPNRSESVNATSYASRIRKN